MTADVQRQLETLALNGWAVTVVSDPELPGRGLTSGWMNFDGSMVTYTIALRNGPDDLDGWVLLHEFLHALVQSDPARTVNTGGPEEESFVRMLTAGLHDTLGYRRQATGAADREDRATEIAFTLLNGVLNVSTFRPIIAAALAQAEKRAAAAALDAPRNALDVLLRQREVLSEDDVWWSIRRLRVALDPAGADSGEGW